MEVKDAPVQIRLDHNTDYVPYSYRIVSSGFFNAPYYLISNKSYETGPPVYSPYPRRLESLTICRCNYKGSTFSSVILRPLVLVRPESNSRPPAWQTDAQPTEPLVIFVPKIWVQSALEQETFTIIRWYCQILIDSIISVLSQWFNWWIVLSARWIKEAVWLSGWGPNALRSGDPGFKTCSNQ